MKFLKALRYIVLFSLQ